MRLTNLQYFFIFKDMEKKIAKENVYYNITWSKPTLCNRHTIMGIPGMAGIACLFQEKGNIIDYLLFYACWKSGVRNGLRDLLDPNFSQFPELMRLSDEKNLIFKYTIIDSNPKDMQDIMYWLIKEYNPLLNNADEFTDSQRFKDIFLKEHVTQEDDLRKINI
jgi:hypothetical protein